MSHPNPREWQTHTQRRADDLAGTNEGDRLAADSGHIAVTIHTDSDLTVKCGNGIWKRKANTDLWAEFTKQRARISTTLKWVRGHNGNTYNEMADQLCTEAMRAHGNPIEPAKNPSTTAVALVDTQAKLAQLLDDKANLLHALTRLYDSVRFKSGMDPNALHEAEEAIFNHTLF